MEMEGVFLFFCCMLLSLRAVVLLDCKRTAFIVIVQFRGRLVRQYRACVVYSLGLGITCLISVYYVYKTSRSCLSYITKELGGVRRSIDLNCDIPPGHASQDVTWYRESAELDTNNIEKYGLAASHMRLTVKNVEHTDEGNYSCKYSNQVVHYNAECLIVYGSASFASGDEDIQVSENGTIVFNLKLSYSASGRSDFRQQVERIYLKNSSEDVVSCFPTAGCTFSIDVARWWTVHDGDTGTLDCLVFILHQALSYDRAEYSANVDLADPAIVGGIVTKSKTLLVTALPCGANPPDIEMGERVTLEPINNDIVGAQANYSCSDGCDLHGSSSLRCRSMGSPVNDYEWVDESTSISPSCICSEPSVSQTGVQKPEMTSQGSTEPSASQTGVKKPEMTSQGSTGLRSKAAAGIAVTVAVVVVLHVGASVTCFVILKKRLQFSSQKNTENRGQVVPDGYDKPEVIRRTYIDPSNTPREFSIDTDDNNRDSVIDNVLFNEDFESENTKNSHPTDI